MTPRIRELKDFGRGERWSIRNGNAIFWLEGVHRRGDCAGEYCVLHHRSRHSMFSFPLIWRFDRALFERICPHGIGHPDPDHLHSLEALGYDDDEIEVQSTHGCDGCCAER